MKIVSLKSSKEKFALALLHASSLLGLKVLLSKQWIGKGFDRDLSQLLDLLYLEQSSGKKEMQVLNFNETFLCEILVMCNLYMTRKHLLYCFV